MASAQVLRNQEHLEAGKKKLEEFRRKKAAEKAKKATSVPQLHSSDGALLEKQPSGTDSVGLADSNGVGTGDALTEGRFQSSGPVANNASREPDISHKSDFSSDDTKSKPSFLAYDNNSNSSVLENSFSKTEEYKGHAASVVSNGPKGVNENPQSRMHEDGSLDQVAFGIGGDHIFAPQTSSIQETSHASCHSSYHVLDDRPSIDYDGPLKDLLPGNAGTSAAFMTDIMPKNSVSRLLQEKLSNSGDNNYSVTSSSYQESVHSMPYVTDSVFGDGQKFPMFSNMGEKKFSSSVENVNHLSPWTSGHKDANYNSHARSPSNHEPPSPPAAGRKSRPSFLDSVQISKGALSSTPLSGEIKVDSSSSEVYPMDGLGSSISQITANSSIASGNGVDLFNHVAENKHDFLSQKQNEDIAALEQHIEDLTQEKFSFLRALEASRALADNLASENSSLTDSFNQQGSVVNQLKSDLEKLQEEIRAQMVELEAVRTQYANAQMECNAADERAKLLASELFGLEEKSLRLRSNELKLEKQLENSHAEISSYRKKMSSLEKDCQHLQSTVNALQEESKLLRSKLQRPSPSRKSIDADKISYNKKDVSTSTEDLDINTATENSNSENSGTPSYIEDAHGSQLSDENILLSLEDLPLTIPSDQLRMIQNINTLIAELALEKDQLMQALSTESSQSSKLLELNKELTRKLEGQTQRLELLTAQSMASDKIQPRLPDSRPVNENMTYADEGDEVVERVLGWIMKLFPGGPSRRGTSKHR